MFRKAVFITLALFSTIAINAAEPADSAATATTKTITIPSQYVPTFHGTFRGFFEQSTTGGGSRFMVRNARFSAQGKVLPIAEYFFQLDLCDKGKLTILDAYVGVTPFKNFTDRRPGPSAVQHRCQPSAGSLSLRQPSVGVQDVRQSSKCGCESGIYDT